MIPANPLRPALSESDSPEPAAVASESEKVELQEEEDLELQEEEDFTPDLTPPESPPAPPSTPGTSDGEPPDGAAGGILGSTMTFLEHFRRAAKTGSFTVRRPWALPL